MPFPRVVRQIEISSPNSIIVSKPFERLCSDEFLNDLHVGALT